VDSHLNLFRPHRQELREHRNLDFQTSAFFQAEGREPRIVQSSRNCALRDGLCQFMSGITTADAPTEFSIAAQRHECSSEVSQATYSQGQIGKSEGGDRFRDCLTCACE
jgi:hypothetical protein